MTIMKVLHSLPFQFACLCLAVIGAVIAGFAAPDLILRLIWGACLGLFFAHMMGMGVRSIQAVVMIFFLAVAAAP
jgi:hypothetical protein